jgi:hypothetical protein
VTVDNKDLVAMHSLTQLAVRGQADKGDRRGIAAAVAQGINERLELDHEKPATFFARLPVRCPCTTAWAEGWFH